MLSLIMHLSNNTTVSVLAAVVFYACVYIYLLMKKDEFMSIFMKVIPYIICIDISFFIFILFQTSEKEVEETTPISNLITIPEDTKKVELVAEKSEIKEEGNIRIQEIIKQDDDNKDIKVETEAEIIVKPKRKRVKKVSEEPEEKNEIQSLDEK